MRAVARVAALALAAGLPGVPLAAQAGWEPPRPPCELVPANSKIDKGIQALRGAQLAQAQKALSEAIVQDNQGTNPAAWYYLGRYYVAVGDAAGADTALARDRKSTRLNSSHSQISYAVFCLKKNNNSDI